MSDSAFSESSINEIFKTCDVESERVGSSTCRAEIKIPSTKGAERECWEFHNIVLTRGLLSYVTRTYFRRRRHGDTRKVESMSEVTVD
ncbi:hypothetical protein TNIN_489751 [Trichonephila inaurata madagascariensis]|uniref:Uncharacterized protein n=1 Tax=Trichonephila inaurata madagascariensis TaxID=2747483 RepID=A0A8X7C611_9ARAC|nr:hypothetical protein TNIN_489751 [Trichonephila inaurata madagascariensis]